MLHVCQSMVDTLVENVLTLDGGCGRLWGVVILDYEGGGGGGGVGVNA